MRNNKNLQKIWQRIGRLRLRLLMWWRRYDRRFGWWWRAVNIVVAAVIVLGIAIPVLNQVLTSDRYKLAASTLKLVGNTDPTLSNRLTYDPAKQMYQFNKDAVDTADNPATGLQSQVGTADSKTKSLYALDVPQTFSKGVTYHDINSQLSFTMTPQFKALDVKEEQGHLVFPLDGGNQAIYTLKNNGLKEDIVMPKVPQGSLSYTYQLNLPKTLAARVIPNSGGAIGIYSADPSLFGNVSYGSDADRALVEKAREQGAKTYLVFGLPSPVIKTPDGRKVGSAHFELQGNKLTVVADHLAGVKGPISIDPSVVITSTSDFQTQGNNEGNIDFSVSGQIGRRTLTGATVSGGWSATSGFNTASFGAAVAVYNGYMYLLGGNTGSGLSTNSVQYAPINTTGTIGAWHYTHNSTDDGTTFVAGFTNARNNAEALAYSGYLYILGGTNSGGSAVYGDVQYAPINANGTVGAWATTSSMTSNRSGFGAAAYGGYMYAYGGCTSVSLGTCSGFSSSVEYAQFNANGTVGSWATTGNMTTTRINMSGVVYNGYLYALGGCVSISLGNCTSLLASVEYAPINANGTVGTWATTTSFSTARSNFAAIVYGGYVYIMGGSISLNDVQYTPLNADGTVGTWSTTSSFTTARFGLAAASNNGYLYIVGGCSSNVTNCGSSLQSDVQYAKVDPAGMTGQYATASYTLSATERGAAVVVNNGYLYILGGDNGGAPATTVQYASINADGTLTSQGTTTAMGVGRTFLQAVAYGGNMYIMGGCSSAFSSCTTATNDLTSCQKSVIASNGTLGGWSTVTCFGTARYGFGLFALGSRMYMVGGANGSTYMNDVYSSAISGSGSLGSWQNMSASYLPVGRAFFGLTTYGSDVYLAGGIHSATDTACNATATQFCSDVMYAVPGTSTSAFTTNWTTSGNFTNARDGLSLMADKGFLYITGGYGNSTYYNDTQYAPINADGTVGSWSTAASFTNGRYAHGSVLTGGYIYIVGGNNGTSYYNSVQYAPVNNGGSGGLGTWVTSNPAFTNTRYGQASVTTNGYVYMLGGVNGSTYYNDVQYAPLNANGSVGTWATTSSFTTARSGLAAAVSNGYMYIFGGYDGTNVYSDAQYALICTGSNSGSGGCGSTVGTLGTWATTSSFTTARQNLSAGAYNGYVYITAGSSPHKPSPTTYNDVQYALVCTSTNSGTGGCTGTPGTVGTWTTATNSFTTARQSAGSLVYNGVLYIMGGVSGGGTYYNDVQYAVICTSTNSGTGGCTGTPGTVGTWMTGGSIGTAESGVVAVGMDGFIYVLGGYDGTTYYNTVQYAPVSPGGGLGNWAASTGFTNARANGSGVAYNGYLYMIGGWNGTAYYNDIQDAPVHAIPRRAFYSKLVNLYTSSTITGFSYNGTIPTGSTLLYKTAGAGGVFGIPGLCMGTVATSNFIFITVLLDDSGSAVFPDSQSAASNVTDMTISYNAVHPAPNIRLRLGQTLQSGTLSNFDTCAP